MDLPNGSNDQGRVDENSIANILFNVKTPTGYRRGETRGLSQSQERAVEQIDVLVFNSSDVLVDIVHAEQLTQSGNNLEFSISVPARVVNTATGHLVALANARDAIHRVLGDNVDGITAANRTFDKISRSLTEQIERAMFSDGDGGDGTIPMWGEARNVTFDFKDVSQVSLKLIRAVARVDLGIGRLVIASDPAAPYPWTWDGKGDNGAEIPFEATEIFVVRPNNTISLIPAAGSVNANGLATAATVSDSNTQFTQDDSWSGFRYDVEERGFSVREIFVPEAVVAAGERGDDQHTERMALVVGGRYNGSAVTTYYRVDFATTGEEGRFVDVLRNKLYLFSIKGVNGAGAATPRAAYEGTSTMTAEMLDWDNGLVENIYLGNNYLVVGKNPAEVAASAMSTLNVPIFTNSLPLELTFGGGGQKLLPGGTHQTQWFDYTLVKGTGDEYSLAIVSRTANVSGEKSLNTDNWRINAGGTIDIPFRVQQLWRPTGSTGLNMVSGGNGSALADISEPEAGDLVTIKAEPDPGYEFVGWTVVAGGAIIGDLTNPEVFFVMPRNEVTIKADFAPRSYTLAVEGDDFGTAAASVNNVVVQRAPTDATVTLTAKPLADYEFVRWVIVDSAKPVTDLDTSLNPATFTMPAGDVSLKAEFRIITYDVSFVVEGNGSATAEPSVVEPGSMVNIKATAEPGHEFLGWSVLSGGPLILGSTSAAETQFMMPKRDIVIRAMFDWKSYNLAVTDNGLGNASATVAGEPVSKVKAGVVVDLNATPQADHELARWVVTNSGGDAVTVKPDPANRNHATFTMPADAVSVHAEFRVIKYNVTFEIVGVGTANTTTVANLCRATAAPTTAQLGETVTITAIPDWRYEFHGWEVVSGGVNINVESNIETTFQMSRSDVVIRAKFDHKLFDITVADDGHGTISSDVPKAKAGTEVTLTARPTIDDANDYMFDRWIDTGGNIPGSGVQTASSTPSETVGKFTMPEGDAEVKVAFRVRDYKVEVITDGKGSVTSSATRSIAGETIDISATKPTGYNFLGWTVLEGGMPVSRNTPTSFVMPRSDVKVRADFVHISVEPYILFLDYNGRLAAGQWLGDGTGPVTPQGTITQDNLLYFKHGSLVGLTTPEDNEKSWIQTFSRTRFFNPTNITMHTGPNIYDGLQWIDWSGYGVIPGYDYRNERSGNVETDKYNSAENMIDGYGDPCRLIGLNADEAREMAQNRTLPNRVSGYMTPKDTWFSTNYVPASKTEWVVVGGRGGRWLKNKANITSFLPAAGNRDRWTVSNYGGTVKDVGVGGFYLHNINNGGGGVYLYVFYEVDDPEMVASRPQYFTSSMMYSQPKQEAAVVRCVKK
jgi:hypothetical protein